MQEQPFAADLERVIAHDVLQRVFELRLLLFGVVRQEIVMAEGRLAARRVCDHDFRRRRVRGDRTLVRAVLGDELVEEVRREDRLALGHGLIELVVLDALSPSSWRLSMTGEIECVPGGAA